MERKLIYGIYPRSFISPDAGKHGSAFRAIADASEKFLQLDPDYVWMNPIFNSDGHDDNHYIASSREVNPILGSKEDFDFLVNDILKGKALLGTSLDAWDQDIRGLDYCAWFKYLVDVSRNENFCFQLESHDSSRCPNRFRTDPRTLAFLSFMLPFTYVCVYQGQEIGMHNFCDLRDIAAICRVDPQIKDVYDALLGQGMSPSDALKSLKSIPCLHARIPASRIYSERYDSQMNPEATLPVLSVFHLYQKLIELWKTDPVLLHGDIVIHNMTQDGVFLFSRVYGDDYWDVQLDFSDSGRSYITNGKTTIY